jgi:hypothetical protein
MSNNNVLNVAYSLGQGPLSPIFPPPVVSIRAPNANDIGFPRGQVWVVKDGSAAYLLVLVASGVATWLSIAGGGAGVFTALTVNPGPTNLSTVGNGAVTIGNATNIGAVTISVGTGNFALNGNGNTIDIGTDAAANTIVIGNGTGATGVTISSGSGGILIGGNAVAQVITIGNSTGVTQVNLNAGTAGVTIGTNATAHTVTIGSTTGASNVVVNSGTGASAFAANATDHSTTVGSTTGVSATTVQGGTAGITLTAPFVALPGPVYIYTGAGAPGNGLALHIGDMYINTTAASAVTRLYIATGVGAWTNVTCAA